MLLLHTLTFSVLSTALIAEVLPTPAVHMITALVLLYPELAFKALLELFALDELQKFLVVLVHPVVNLVLFARLSLVKDDSAF